MIVESVSSDGPVVIQVRPLNLFIKIVPLSSISLGKSSWVGENRNKNLERSDFEPTLLLLWISLFPSQLGIWGFGV